MADVNCFKILPREIWSLIAENCSVDPFVSLIGAFPELGQQLPQRLKKLILFEKIFWILYGKKYIGFETAKILREVCWKWCSVVRNYFLSTNKFSLLNQEYDKVNAKLVIWLPMRLVDVDRLKEMSQLSVGCPVFSKTLVLRYPYMRKVDSLDRESCVKVINSLSKLWNTFLHLQLEMNDEYLAKIFDPSGDLINDQYREEYENNLLWTVSECYVTGQWMLPFFENMQSLETLKSNCFCMTNIIAQLLTLENMARLKGILGLCTEDECFTPIIQACSSSLELLRVSKWSVLCDVLGKCSFPILKELHFFDPTWNCESEDELQKLGLLLKRVPKLKVVLTFKQDDHKIARILEEMSTHETFETLVLVSSRIGEDHGGVIWSFN